MPGFYRWDNTDLILTVRLQPRASNNSIAEADDNGLRIRLTAPPVDGKANAALKKFLGKIFGIAPSTIELLSGESSRNKRLRIPSPKQLPAVIQARPRPD